jgi:hypothetical protein
MSSSPSTPGLDALATVLWIPQAIGHALDELDLRLEAFDDAVEVIDSFCDSHDILHKALVRFR